MALRTEEEQLEHIVAEGEAAAGYTAPGQAGKEIVVVASCGADRGESCVETVLVDMPVTGSGEDWGMLAVVVVEERSVRRSWHRQMG